MEEKNYLKKNSQQMRAMRRMMKAAQKWQLGCGNDESRHVDYTSSETTVYYNSLRLSKFAAHALTHRFDYTVFSTHITIDIDNERVDGDPEDALNTFMRL